MTYELYENCNLWLLKLWQTYYEKHIYDKSIMTFVTAPYICKPEHYIYYVVL